MKLKPVYTEQSLADAKNGKYSFWVHPGLTKLEIKALVNSSFEVHVKRVTTVMRPGGTKRTVYGKIQKQPARKRAIVTLKQGEKISLFEEEKKSKGGKKNK